MNGAEIIAFESSSPESFRDLLGREPELPRVALRGFLSLPRERPAPLPLVIITIGSLGLASGREELYSEALTDAGIATFVVDSFAARGVSETASDQGRVSLPASCADALHALRSMADDPRIDAKRIGLFGYSRGGCAVLLCNDVRMHAAIAGSPTRFASYAAYYPSIWLRWQQPLPTDAPCLIVTGTADDLAPPHIVEERASALRAAGASVTVNLIPEAVHSFDARSRAQWSAGETNMSGCDVVIENDGTMCERTSGVRFEHGWPDFVQRLRAACGKLGGTTGHGPHPRTVAVSPLVEFVSGVPAA